MVSTEVGAIAPGVTPQLQQLGSWRLQLAAAIFRYGLLTTIDRINMMLWLTIVQMVYKMLTIFD